MTEIRGNGPASPAAANRQPLSPEDQLSGRLTSLVDDVVAHYEGLDPHNFTNRPHPQGGVIETYVYRDGAERRVTTTDQDTVETKIHTSGTILGPQGRRVLLVSTKHADGPQEYDLRFLPSPSKGGVTYRWSAGQPVAEVIGKEKRPLVAHTGEFDAAWISSGQVDGQLRTLMGSHRQPEGTIPVVKTGAKLFGALATIAAGRSQRRQR